MGMTLITLTGGEPFMREARDRFITRMAAEFPNLGFLVYTNSTMITEEVAQPPRRGRQRLPRHQRGGLRRGDRRPPRRQLLLPRAHRARRCWPTTRCSTASAPPSPARTPTSSAPTSSSRPASARETCSAGSSCCSPSAASRTPRSSSRPSSGSPCASASTSGAWRTGRSSSAISGTTASSPGGCIAAGQRLLPHLRGRPHLALRLRAHRLREHPRHLRRHQPVQVAQRRGQRPPALPEVPREAGPDPRPPRALHAVRPS